MAAPPPSKALEARPSRDLRLPLLLLLGGVCLLTAATPRLSVVAPALCLAVGTMSGYLFGQRAGILMSLYSSALFLLGTSLRTVPGAATGLVAFTTVVGGAALGRMSELFLRIDGRRSRRQATDLELTARRLEHEALLLAIPDAITRIDRAGTILGGHGGADETSRSSVGWSVGKNVADILPHESAKGALESIHEVLTNHEPTTFEYRLGGPRKSLFGAKTAAPREFEARLVRGGAHEVLGIIRDITDIKKLEEKLNEAHRDALQAAGTKGRFLATMSHQIRTPMNGVIGMTNVLMQTKLTPEQREYTSIIRNSGEALLSILDDVLDYSKIEEGQMELGRAPFALRALLEELVELLAARAHDKGLEIASIIDARVPAWVQGDRGRLRQVIINLLGNAIKFTRHGHVVLRAVVVGHERDTALIRFDVVDTGVGIPTEHQKNLFQDYGQASSNIAREFGGTGLGLAISRQIVELMGGRMLVESSEGVGSTFSFTARFITIQDRTTGSFLLPRALSGAHIVSFGLNPLTQELMNHQLSPFGAKFVVTHALDQLSEALSEHGPFDVAVVELPLGMSEKEAEILVRSVVKIGGTMPVAALCSLGQRAIIDHARRAGASIVLSRPLRRSALYDGLVELLGLTARASPRNAIAGKDPTTSSDLRARVLVVEDNLVNQKVAVRTLEMLGCHTEVAENGALAIEALKEREFDVVLMDCQMPVLDGFEATRQIRSFERETHKRTPIIALTANAMHGDRERCLQAGMDDYVPKPLTVAALDASLRKWLPDRVIYRRRSGPPAGSEKAD